MPYIQLYTTHTFDKRRPNRQSQNNIVKQMEKEFCAEKWGKNFSQDQINWEKKKHACVTNTITLRPYLLLCVVPILSICFQHYHCHHQHRFDIGSYRISSHKIRNKQGNDVYICWVVCTDKDGGCWWGVGGRVRKVWIGYSNCTQRDRIASHLALYTAMKRVAVCCYWCSCLFQMGFRWQVVSGPCDWVWNCKQKQIPIYELNANKI